MLTQIQTSIISIYSYSSVTSTFLTTFSYAILSSTKISSLHSFIVLPTTPLQWQYFNNNYNTNNLSKMHIVLSIKIIKIVSLLILLEHILHILFFHHPSAMRILSALCPSVYLLTYCHATSVSFLSFTWRWSLNIARINVFNNDIIYIILVFISASFSLSDIFIWSYFNLAFIFNKTIFYSIMFVSIIYRLIASANWELNPFFLP